MATRTIRTETTRVFWFARTAGGSGPDRHTEVNGQEYLTFTGRAGIVREEVGCAGTSYWAFNGEIVRPLPVLPGGYGITDVAALARLADGEIP